MNIYSQILKNNIPRLLNLYNLDPGSGTYGFGDRLYWGWKISDFPNGSFQGGVHALAIAIRLGLIEHEPFALSVVDCAIRAVAKIRERDGSLAEAFPGEHSFCVTALVAFDVLSALHHLEGSMSADDKKTYLNIIRPLIGHLSTHDEKHAVISNHLATAAAAIVLWNRLAGERNDRYRHFLDIIYGHQSPEGWYQEYEGADPGYQTLCTYYLSIVLSETGDAQLRQSLTRSAQFLKYFVHPDGTIGGLYGSRNTEVYYPGGVVALSAICDEFSDAAFHMQRGITAGCHVLPDSIDPGNFIPLLNSYAAAAVAYDTTGDMIERWNESPPLHAAFTRDFPDAGIFVAATSAYYAIVNYKKGGTVKVFDRASGMLDAEDGGLFGRLHSGKRFSTQLPDPALSFDGRTVASGFYLLNDASPGPWQFILLRSLSSTLFRVAFARDLFKKAVVQMLMTGKKRIDGMVERRFEFLNDRIIVHETITPPRGCISIGHAGTCKSIHMASSGYHIRNRETMSMPSRILQFRTEEPNAKRDV